MMKLTRIGAAIATLALAAPAMAANVNGLGAGVQWTAASGPVGGYEVWVQRGTGAYAKQQSVTGLQAPISGADGESIKVKVRAIASYDGTVLGAFSPESDTITFHAAIGPVSGSPTIIIQCSDPSKPKPSLGTDGIVSCVP